jgi:hypothetical protein
MSKHSQWEQFANEPSRYPVNPKKKRGKLTVVLYKGEVHVLGSPNNMEVVIMNLDKEINDEPISDNE